MNALPSTLIAALVTAAGLAGCLGGGQGTAAVYVKDAASDEFQNLFATFSQVQVHRGDPGDEAEPDEGTWVTLVGGERTVDLLVYSEEGSRAFLGEEDLAAGTYSMIVITVTDARGVRHDGSEADIEVSSGNLRLVRAFNVSADTTTRIVLDFDLDRPGVLVQEGRPGGDGAWRFTPVVGKVIVEEDASGSEGDVPDGGAGEGTTATATPTTQGGVSGSGGSGMLTTYVKDAATDEFDGIWITFDSVEAHRAPGGANGTGNETAQEAEGTGGWTVVVSETRSVNLMNFSQDGSKAFLGAEELPAGRYTQIRLNVTEAWGVKPDGNRTDFTVTTPSVKVVRSFNVTDGGTTQIVIDVDLDRSVHRQGPPGSDEWRLVPVIGRLLVDEDAQGDPMMDEPDPS